MSRSKRAPYWVDGYGSPDKKRRKRVASRRVRDSDEVPSGGAYKKFYETWNISDYTFYDPKNLKVRRKWFVHIAMLFMIQGKSMSIFDLIAFGMLIIWSAMGFVFLIITILEDKWVL